MIWVSTVYELVGADQLRDAPGLCDAPSRRVGRVAVEYLRVIAQASILGEVAHERLDEFGGVLLALLTEFIDLQVCLNKWAYQVRPDGTLVVGFVTLSRRAGVDAFVSLICGAEGPQAVRCQQFLLDGVDDCLLLGVRQRREA